MTDRAGPERAHPMPGHDRSEPTVEMVEQLLSRTDAAYRRWLASIVDDVVADRVVVFCRESLPERHTTYGIGEWLTGYLMIGQEGDRGMFLRCDAGAGPVFQADLGSGHEADLHVVAPVFEAWLDSRFALPPDPEPDLPPTADVYVDNVPADAVQLLVGVRKLLGADWRYGDLRTLLAAQPFLATRSAPLYALRHRLEVTPELRPYVHYATGHGLEAVWSPGPPTKVS